jgi:hypothetical protein
MNKDQNIYDVNAAKDRDFNFFEVQETCEKLFPTRDKHDNKLEVTDLFSLFTADIIKKQVVFSR